MLKVETGTPDKYGVSTYYILVAAKSEEEVSITLRADWSWNDDSFPDYLYEKRNAWVSSPSGIYSTYMPYDYHNKEAPFNDYTNKNSMNILYDFDRKGRSVWVEGTGGKKGKFEFELTNPDVSSKFWMCNSESNP